MWWATSSTTRPRAGGRARKRDGPRPPGQQQRDGRDGRRARCDGDRWSRDRYVTGLYPTAEAASRAYSGLTTEHGYKADDINVVMSDDTRKRHFGDVTPGTELSGGTKAAEGLGKGSAIGGGIGAALGALFAIGTSIVVPVSDSSSPARSRRLWPVSAPAGPPAG